MKNLKFYLIVFYAINLFLLSSCATVDTTAEYGPAISNNNDLIVPPDLTTPEFNPEFKLPQESNINFIQNTGDVTFKSSNLHIVASGTERWLNISNTTLDKVWPKMLSFIGHMGLSVKKQEQNLGIIETNWVTRNNEVPQIGVRGLFQWLGWGSMYSLPSKFMFRITVWPDSENNVLVFVTAYQMDEVYAGCVEGKNYTVSTSNNQLTTWMPRPHNSQVELDFLLHFVDSVTQNSKLGNTVFVKPHASNLATQVVSNPRAYLKDEQLVILDDYDKAWWRTVVALGRANLGITSQDKKQGTFEVYSLQGEVNNPNPGFFDRLFGKESSLEIPKPTMQVKLTPSDNQTILTINPYHQQASVKPEVIAKYLKDLESQLK